MGQEKGAPFAPAADSEGVENERIDASESIAEAECLYIADKLNLIAKVEESIRAATTVDDLRSALLGMCTVIKHGLSEDEAGYEAMFSR